MSDKGYWTPTGKSPVGRYNEFDGTLEVSMAGGHFVLAIAQERAVDSYNSEFTCSTALSEGQARSLRDWLTALLDESQ